MGNRPEYYLELSCGPWESDDDEDNVVNRNEDVNGDGDLMNDDTDGDSIPDYQDPDDDGDGVITFFEDPNLDRNPMNDDTDGDSIPNYQDVDDDGDGVLTVMEDPNGDGNLMNDDTDLDGILNYLDFDDDGDRVPTIMEDPNGDGNLMNDDTNGNGIPNFLDPDDTSWIDNLPDNENQNGRVTQSSNKEDIIDDLTSSVLYPNPSSGNINITGLNEDLNYQITVTDISGTVIRAFTFTEFVGQTNELRMELRDLPNGIYIMQMGTGKGQKRNFKFMIAK